MDQCTNNNNTEGDIMETNNFKKKVLAFDFEETNMYRNLYIVRNKEMYMSKGALKFIRFMRDFFEKETSDETVSYNN